MSDTTNYNLQANGNLLSNVELIQTVKAGGDNTCDYRFATVQTREAQPLEQDG
jgi:hypothetical protein